MKREADNNALLKDVFGEAAPASLREALLGESVRVVQRRRTARRMGRAGAAFVLLVLTVLLARQTAPRHAEVLSRAAPVKVQKSYRLVSSQSLPAASIITTRLLSSGEYAAGAGAVRIVRTRHGDFSPINDQQLLSIISPRPCALITIGPNAEKLVFINPEDAKSFRVN